MVNLFSDTQTRPTPEMREAIARAEVGDEQRRADPTVIALEERVAELLGHEAALFAAGGLYALDHHVDRLADDHARARRLAEGLAELPDVEIDASTVETNIVIFTVPDARAFCDALAREDVVM